MSKGQSFIPEGKAVLLFVMTPDSNKIRFMRCGATGGGRTTSGLRENRSSKEEALECWVASMVSGVLLCLDL